MLIDILKTLVPVLIFSIIGGKYFDEKQLFATLTGVCCMIGHAYPLWYRFKGGKTFMAMATAIWFIDWRMGLIFLAVFILLLFTVKFMSLSSMTAAASCPVALLILGTDNKFVVPLAFFAAALLIFRHKANIVRLIKGEESKFSLFGKKKG